MAVQPRYSRVASGLRHDKVGNRAKSRSVVTGVAPCLIAMAASAASMASAGLAAREQPLLQGPVPLSCARRRTRAPTRFT